MSLILVYVCNNAIPLLEESSLELFNFLKVYSINLLFNKACSLDK